MPKNPRPATPTAKSDAERQSDYRRRRKENNDKRLDLYISQEAAEMLNMLAIYHGKNKKEIIEKLIRKKFKKDDLVLPAPSKEKQQHFPNTPFPN